jgi:hypothetical protein
MKRAEILNINPLRVGITRDSCDPEWNRGRDAIVTALALASPTALFYKGVDAVIIGKICRQMKGIDSGFHCRSLQGIRIAVSCLNASCQYSLNSKLA